MENAVCFLKPYRKIKTHAAVGCLMPPKIQAQNMLRINS